MELKPYIITEAFWQSFCRDLKKHYPDNNDFYLYLLQYMDISEGGRQWITEQNKNNNAHRHYTYVIPQIKKQFEEHPETITTYLPKYNLIDKKFYTWYNTLNAELLAIYAKSMKNDGYDLYKTIDEYVEGWPRNHKIYLRLLDRNDIAYNHTTMSNVIAYLSENASNGDDEKNMLYILNYFTKNPNVVPIEQQQELFCVFTDKFKSISKSSIKKFEKIKAYFETLDFSAFYDKYPHIEKTFSVTKSYDTSNGHYFMFEMDVNRFAFDNKLDLTTLKYSLQNMGKFVKDNEEIKEKTLVVHIPEHRPSELKFILVFKSGDNSKLNNKLNNFFAQAVDASKQPQQVLSVVYAEIWDKLSLYLDMQESLPVSQTTVKRPKI